MALPVTVIEAKKQRVPIIVEVVGQAEGSKEVEVRARASGILTRQLYREGDTVHAGAMLFTIDRAPYEIALAQARAALSQSEANLEMAQREAARLKPLVEQKAVSQKDYDTALTTQQTSEAAVMSAQATVREAELNLSYTNVTAPITGVTGRAQHSEGSLVAANSDSGLLTTISVVDPIWVRFSFSESEAAKLRQVAGKAKVKLVLPDDSVYEAAGRLNFAASTVNTQTGMVSLRAEFPNPKLAILPGQFVRVQIATSERDAYLVPQSAVVQTDKGKVLFTASADNKVAPRPIEASGWLGYDWIVTKGLADGDKVIVDNLMKLRPDAPIAPHAPGQGPSEGTAPGAAGAPPQAQKSDAKVTPGSSSK
jgi:membrane fusion protein (multidrug efflux system)